jgi:hypothetical protein
LQRHQNAGLARNVSEDTPANPEATGRTGLSVRATFDPAQTRIPSPLPMQAALF